MLRHTLAGGLVIAAAGCVLAGGSVAQADIYAPYARAAAIVDTDGTLNNHKNVTASSRVAKGHYCVRIGRSVDVTGGLIQITPRVPNRLPYIAYRNPSALCDHAENTLAVVVYDPTTGHLADGGFDVAVL
ncbi:hypothetical protein [Nonomuraea sp. NPDC049709]|uniref:hypothetical protein n=1 Tax=Nonomuraea sp. NPDC049709 TaxID=3154736 RepID=UPI0034380668